MTLSRGIRDAQKRREELFSGELRLTRVAQHLLDARSYLKRLGDRAELTAVDDAAALVCGLIDAMRKEFKAL